MFIARKIGWIIALLFLFSLSARAETRIAVLDFELNDITLNPRIPEEVERTASLKPLLEERLVAEGGYRIVPLAPDAQENATKSFGYLWDHPDEAAALGKAAGAQYVVVGRVNKPSFLFVYFLIRLIDTETKKLIGEFGVEVKGQQKKITPKGIENLAGQIVGKLQTRRPSR